MGLSEFYVLRQDYQAASIGSYHRRGAPLPTRAQPVFRTPMPVSADVQRLHDQGSGKIWSNPWFCEGNMANSALQSILPGRARSALKRLD